MDRETPVPAPAVAPLPMSPELEERLRESTSRVLERRLNR
jgi:hypothetical protein